LKKISDNEVLLIHALKNGSHKAFDSIYQMYAKRLYYYSLQFTKSREDSEEIVQDVFVKLWTNREKIKQENTLCSLLFIMTKHHMINAFRANINRPIYEIYVNYNHEMSINDAHQHIEYQEFVVKFKKAIKKLPATQQKVITLSRIQQLSNREIAEKLSLSGQTVKNQLSIGLKMLKQELGKLSCVCYLFVNSVVFFGTI
jgi:RNA polymerase sigma-70 factor (ECF subfamily)